MRRKTKPLSKTRDETEDVVQILQNLEADNLPATKQMVVKKLMRLKKINEETALTNIECAIALRSVIVLHKEDGTDNVLADRLKLRSRRQLILKPGMDLNIIVLQSMKEIGAKGKFLCKSFSEIETHISATYDVKSQISDLLPNLISKSIRSLIRKNSINTKSDCEDQATRYYLPGTSSDSNNEEFEPAQDQQQPQHKCLPSTSTQHSEEMENDVEEIKPPIIRSSSRNSGIGRRIKRTSEVSQNSDNPNYNTKGELKGLQDSLSAFFTPLGSRRSRLASNNAPQIDCRPQSSMPSISESKPIDKELEVVIDDHPHMKFKCPTTSSSECSLKSPAGSSATTPSPHRRLDQLTDALSPFFSAPAERRRRHEKGDYLSMNNGVPLKKKSEDEREHIVQFLDGKPELENCKSEEVENECPLESEMPRAASPSRRVRTPKNKQSVEKVALRNSASLSGLKKSAHQFKKESTVAAMKSASLIKRARGNIKAGRNAAIAPTNKNRIKMINAQPVSSSVITNNIMPTAINRSLTSPIRSVKGSPVKAFNEAEPSDIPEEDCKMFDKAREIAQKDLYDSTKVMMSNVETQAYPPRVRINRYEIESWYSAPFPQEYASLQLLHVCGQCLMYLADQQPHMKCKAKYPPGNEIYRSNDISVFEVDGNLARVYCRNLCLLAKLFIDHKTLYFDVEPFLFYVLTVNDSNGCHFVGYFSKEKFSSQKYNLACIVTLPCYQTKGYGRFLIDFSYLLSRREGLAGTPERPLSELGKIAYQSYWRTAIFEYIYRTCIAQNGKSITLQGISDRTGIAVHDVVESLTQNGMLRVGSNAMISLTINVAQIKEHWERAQVSKARIWMDEKKLLWSPKVYTPSKEFHLRSPTFSVDSSPTPKRKSKNKVESKAGEDTKKKTPKKSRKNSIKRRVIESPEEETSETISAPVAVRSSSGKMGRKRPPGKVIDEKKKKPASSLPNSDEEEDDEEEYKARPRKIVACKPESPKKLRRQKTSSSDDSPDREKKAKTHRTRANIASTSTRAATSSHKRGDTSKARRTSNVKSRSNAVNDALTPSTENLADKSQNRCRGKFTKIAIPNKILLKEPCDSLTQPNSTDSSGSSTEYEKSKKSYPVKSRKTQKGIRPSETASVTKAPPSTSNNQVKHRKASISSAESSSPPSSEDEENGSDDEEERIFGGKQKKRVKPSVSKRNSKKICSQKKKFISTLLSTGKTWISDASSRDSSSDEEEVTELEAQSMESEKKGKHKPILQANRHRRPRLFNNDPTSDDEEEEDDSEEGEDEEYGSSSKGVKKSLDRVFKSSLQKEPDFVNVGGEPSTVNMGFDGDGGGSTSNEADTSLINPNAPLPPQANISVIEEEESGEAESDNEQPCNSGFVHPMLGFVADKTAYDNASDFPPPMLQLQQNFLQQPISFLPPKIAARSSFSAHVEQGQTSNDRLHDNNNFEGAHSPEGGNSSEMPVLDRGVTPLPCQHLDDEPDEAAADDDDDDDDAPPQLSPHHLGPQESCSKMSPLPPRQEDRNQPAELIAMPSTVEGKHCALVVPEIEESLHQHNESSSSNMGVEANSSFESAKSLPVLSATQAQHSMIEASTSSSACLMNGTIPSSQTMLTHQTSSGSFDYPLQHVQSAFSLSSSVNDYNTTADATKMLAHPKQITHSTSTDNCLGGRTMSYSGSSHQTMFSPPPGHSAEPAPITQQQVMFGSAGGVGLLPNSSMASGGICSPLQMNAQTSGIATGSEVIDVFRDEQQQSLPKRADASLIHDAAQSQAYATVPIQSGCYPTSFAPELVGAQSVKKSSKEKGKKEVPKRRSKKGENQPTKRSLSSSSLPNPLLAAHQAQFMQTMPDYVNAMAMPPFNGMTNGSMPHHSYYPTQNDYFGASAGQMPYASQGQYPANLLYNNTPAGWPTNPYYGTNYPTAAGYLGGMRSPTNPPASANSAVVAAANQLGAVASGGLSGGWPQHPATATPSQYYPQPYQYPSYGAH